MTAIRVRSTIPILFVPVRGVDLLALRDIGNALDTGNAGDRLHDSIGVQINHIQETCSEMSGKQVVVIVVNREVVESTPWRSRQVDHRRTFQGGPSQLTRGGGTAIW